MVDAAVGFQCPSCVAEGRKSTRSGRAAYGGLRSGNPGLTSTVLIGINAAVWIAILATGWSSSRLVPLLGLRPRGFCSTPQGGFAIGQAQCEAGGGTWLPGVSDGAWWQLLTSAFTHVEIWHIAGNMLALWFLGPQLEQAFGRTRFLALYLLSALAGSAMVYWASPEFQLTLGASGAIFGLVGGLLVVAHKVHADLRGLLVWLAIMSVYSLAVPHVSWQGHLGGFLGGVAVASVVVYAPHERRTLWQSAGLSAVTLALLAAILAVTASLT
jgi:membrane associated rhomboid family serine protease